MQNQYSGDSFYSSGKQAKPPVNYTHRELLHKTGVMTKKPHEKKFASGVESPFH